MDPTDYPRRILLCVSGLSPQIITETLYALAVAQQPSFIPSEIHLITTAEGAERARLTLLHGDTSWFHRLCRDYELTGIRFADDTIHILDDGHGAALKDIRIPSDNQRAADQITAVVRKLTAESDSAVHASIAGGRKTMGFYLGYAMSLFGRAQDRLSHVLVSSPFEFNQQFFYPTRESRVIYTPPPEQRPLDTRDAQVTLAEIPFVRLRDGLDEALLNGEASFSETVRRAQSSLAIPELVLDAGKGWVRCGETALRLTPISFAWLAWFARRVLDGLPPLHWKGVSHADIEGFLGEYKAALNDPLADDEHSKIVTIRQKGITKEFLEQRNSKLKRELSSKLGSKIAEQYAVRTKGRSLEGYALDLPRDRIRFGVVERD